MLRCVVQSLMVTLCAGLFSVALGGLAQAQTTTVLPSYTVVDLGPMGMDKSSNAARDPKVMFKDIRNEEMRKTLMLQNQITMINALTNWQSQVSKMEETYINAGLPFDAPKPPRYICEQVPANTVCGDAYEDLAPEPDMMATLPVVPSDMADPNLKKLSSAKKKKQQEPVEPPVSYSWTDIRCKGLDCTAVLVDDNGGARITVMQGESIDDGIMVQTITPESVTITVRGKTEKLSPSDQPAHKFAKSAPTNSISALGDALGTAPPSDKALQVLNDKDKPTVVPAAPEDPVVLDDGSGSATTDSAEAAANGTPQGGNGQNDAVNTGLF